MKRNDEDEKFKYPRNYAFWRSSIALEFQNINLELILNPLAFIESFLFRLEQFISSRHQENEVSFFKKKGLHCIAWLMLV